MSLSEIEIEHQCYCPEHGYFCRYLDKASGLCIATTCRHAQELLQTVELERQAKAKKEQEEGKLALVNELWEHAIEMVENYGASTVELDISEEDLNDIERGWANVRCPTEED